MRLILFSISLLFVAAVSGQSLVEQFHKHKSHWQLESASRSAHSASVSLPLGDVDLNYVDLKVQLWPGQDTISGQVLHRFTALKSMAEVQFDCADQLKIDSVEWKGSGFNLEFNQSNHVLSINLGQPLDPEEEASVTIYYHGKPDNTNRLTAVGDTTEAGELVFWSLSQPYGAKSWWPTRQTLGIKLDSVAVSVSCPDSLQGVSIGPKISETVAYGWRTSVFKHRHPIAPYLISVNAASFELLDDSIGLLSGDTIPFPNYVYKSMSETEREKRLATQEIMDLFENYFGTYPFADEQYGHVQFTRGGGMEHQTMSSMGGFNYGLIAHELAHQWFGDHITCASWQDLWLNEGFATWAAAFAYEKLKGVDTARLFWDFYSENILHLEEGRGAVFQSDTSEVSVLFSPRMVYQKGAWVLRMLRYKLGDNIFFEGLKNYAQSPSLKDGFARTADFQRYLEDAAGISLDDFFDRWVYTEGGPKYTLDWIQHDDRLHIVLYQFHHLGNDVFEIGVPVKLYSHTGDTVIMLQPTKAEQEFIIRGMEPIDSIAFDPDNRILDYGHEVRSIKPEISEGQLFRAFPNPAGNQLEVSYYYQSFPEVDITIYDSKGSEISRDKYETSFTGRQLKLDLTLLRSGVYTLQLSEASGELHRLRVVKH